MNGKYLGPHAFLELIIRVLADTRTPKYKISCPAYIFALTDKEQPATIRAAAELYSKKLAFPIIANAGTTDSGYSGFEFCKRGLSFRGVPEDAVVTLINDELRKGVNTLIEAKALVALAKKNRWEEITIISAPFHQIRCFITVVSVLLKEYPELRVYNCPSEPFPWMGHSSHSQGTLKGKRKDFITAELDRIVKYHEKGDLASLEEVLQYLNQRDSLTVKSS